MNARTLSVTALTRVEEFRKLTAEWKDLAEHAAEANVFYEDWMLLPALELLKSEEKLQIVVVRDGAEGPLLGLFPLERRASYKKLPLSHLRLWQHRHCFLCTPLVRQGRVTETIAAFCDWASSTPGQPRLLLWNWIGGDGPIFEAIRAHASRKSWPASQEGFVRSVLTVRPADPEAYLDSVLSGGHRRDLKRLERRLAESGTFAYETIRAGDAPEKVARWIAEFLEIEASGWKGRQKTAMTCNEPDREYFHRVVNEGFARGKLTTLEAKVEGKPIASRCNFTAGKTAFSFKIAFDEKHSKSRPGLLLEVEHVRQAFASSLEKIDYCADPGHPMLDRMSADRKPIVTLALALRLFEGLALRIIPHAEKLHARLTRPSKTKAAPKHQAAKPEESAEPGASPGIAASS